MITIILPVYKATFFEKSLSSLVNQSFGDTEIIVYNDCSPETSKIEDILDKYSDNRNIKYYKGEQNIGSTDLIGLWNSLLVKANGNYVLFAGDDDVYEEHFLSKIAQAIEVNPSIDIFYSRLRIIDEKDTVVYIAASSTYLESQADFIYNREVLGRTHAFQSFVFRKEALLKIGGIVNYPYAWYSDIATCIILSENGIIAIPEELFCWRKSGFNISSSNNYNSKKVIATFQYYSWLRGFSESLFQKNTDIRLQLVSANLQKKIEEDLRNILISERLLKLSFVKVIKQMMNEDRKARFSIGFLKITLYSIFYKFYNFK